MQYIKYEFDTLPEILLPVKNAEGEIIKENQIEGDVVILSSFNIKDAVLDEDGNEIEPAIKSTKIPVDIFYRDEPEESLEAFRVSPKKPKHTIVGQNHNYLKTLD